MADNVAITAGSGTTIAADDIGGVLHQRVKLSQGADGVGVDVSSAAPLQVTLANTGTNATAVKVDGSAVTQPVSGTVTITPSGTQTVSGTVAVSTINSVAPAFGSGVRGATVQRVTVATDDSVPVTAATLPLPSGAATSALQSTQDTSINTLLKPASTLAAVTTVSTVTNLSQMAGAAIAMGTGVRSAGTQRVTIATDDSVPVTIASVPSHAVTNAGTFATQESGALLTSTQLLDDVVTAQATAIGTTKTSLVGVSTTTAAPTYTTGTINPLNSNTAGALRVDGSGITQPVSGTITANAGTGTMAVSMATNTPLGTVAHDGADSGAPIKVGGRARSSEITAVASDDRSDFVTDLTGKQIVLPYANPENFVSGAITTAMTATTSTSLVAAPGAGLRNYITTIIVSNAHATVGTDVAIQDGSGGTTLLTIPAAAVYGGAVITLPTPLRQPTANTAIFCANVTTGASTKVSAVGYKGA